jgi:hypothetical protein
MDIYEALYTTRAMRRLKLIQSPTMLRLASSMLPFARPTSEKGGDSSGR